MEAWDGELVELRGDEALAVFSSARQALRAAVELQAAFEQETLRARSRELLASAVVVSERDPGLAKLLAVEATARWKEPTLQSTSVLHDVLASDPVVARYRWSGDDVDGDPWVDLSPDGETLVASGVWYSPTEYLEVADARTGEPRWRYPGPDRQVAVGPSFFSADGTQVISGLYEDRPDVGPSRDLLGVVILDAATGQLVRRIPVGGCGGQVIGVAAERVLVRGAMPAADAPDRCVWPNDPAVLTVNLATGGITVLADAAPMGYGGTMSGDGRLVGYEVVDGEEVRSLVFDVATGQPVFEVDPASRGSAGENYMRNLSPDGSLLLYGDRPIRVFDLAGDGRDPIAEWFSPGGEGSFAEFDASGESVFATARDGILRQWEARTGSDVTAWPTVGSGRPSLSANGERVMVGDIGERTAVLLDLGLRGELGAVQGCGGFIPGNSLSVGDGQAAYLQSCDDGSRSVLQLVDLEALRPLATYEDWGAQQARISPDGTSFAGQELIQGNRYGPLMVADVDSGAVRQELAGLCRWDDSIATPADRQPGCAPIPGRPFPSKMLCRWVDGIDAASDAVPGCPAVPQPPFPWWTGGLRWSPDGAMLAAGEGGGWLGVWAAHDGRLLFLGPRDARESVFSALFTPDASALVIGYADTGLIEVVSTSTWETIRSNRLDPSVYGVSRPRLISLTPDGRSIVAWGDENGQGGGSLFWIDVDTLTIERTVTDIHSAAPKTAALSPDGALVATGGSDGSLRVWSEATGQLLQRLELGEQVQGIAFKDDRHIVVTTMFGGPRLMTIDPVELETLVASSLTRGFTATECATYDIDPCPTLEEMRGEAPGG